MGLTVTNAMQDCDTSDTEGELHGNSLYYHHNCFVYLMLFPPKSKELVEFEFG